MSKERMYGYVRVSAQEQNEERQLIAMREFGVEEEYIVIEKQSGKDFKRPRYRAMLRQMHSAVRINAYANMDAGMEGNGQRKRYVGEL